jgi:hypothetical protein
MGSVGSIDAYDTAVRSDLIDIEHFHRGFAGPDRLVHRNASLSYIHRNALKRSWKEVALLGVTEAAKYSTLITRFMARDPILCQKEAEAAVAYGAAGFPNLDASIVGNMAYMSLNAQGTTCEETVRLRVIFGHRFSTIAATAEPIPRSCFQTGC